MADAGHEYAEGRIEAVTSEIQSVYAEAAAKAEEELRKHLERFEAKDTEFREAVEAGDMPEADWRAWRKRQMIQGRRWRELAQQMAEGYTSANQTAAQVINGELPAVAAENANYGAYQVDSAAGVDTSFSLQDEGTVHTLLSGSSAYLPEVSVAAAADIAWNRKGIQSAVTQGILLGESIPKIAKRMQGVGVRNRAQAVRWARTYTTAAENAGRVASYERAKGMGIKLKQEWLATLDGRTRHSHRQLDGERREVGKRFSNGCRYPGDPQAAYAEICNCRCTLVAAVDGIDQGTADRFSRLSAGTTYEQWKAGKAESAHDSTGRTMGEFMQTPLVQKQLAKRGLTEAQGRKLLSEQLKADGGSGHRFRTITKQQQRKAWNGAIRESGAISGALNNTNDPDGTRRLSHAESYYREIRERNKETEVARIAGNSGITESHVSKAYDHLFVNEYDLADGHHRFYEDYEIAQSWQRLSEGKEIKPHDLTLIQHESYEYDLMNSGMGYEEAHKITEEVYNYRKGLLEYWKQEGVG